MKHRLYTLIFPMDIYRNRVLLGMKKRGFGQNKLNGFGGKVEADESVAQGASRELCEESGLSPTEEPEKCGLLLFYFENDPVAMEVHVFITRSFAGQPQETDEMRPEWFDIREMPFEHMWADDPSWWPYVLDGKLFVGRFWFKADMVTITRQELAQVGSLDFSAK
ncbi:7,8-dihydro-8-oxoguanine triphosphatase-like protein [Coemansia spiralis]|nr:7,8-dihydro-8-oxoguanine triphosphatase-like protein [Coemansia spiralis]